MIAQNDSWRQLQTADVKPKRGKLAAHAPAPAPAAAAPLALGEPQG